MYQVISGTDQLGGIYETGGCVRSEHETLADAEEACGETQYIRRTSDGATYYPSTPAAGWLDGPGNEVE